VCERENAFKIIERKRETEIEILERVCKRMKDKILMAKRERGRQGYWIIGINRRTINKVLF
jgi:hypothetical protein